MGKKTNLGGIFLVLITTALILVIGFTRIDPSKAKTAYMVYLDGKKLGLIENKDELYTLIDDEQESIKSEYKVEKVYPPKGLEAIEYTTYNNNIKTAEQIYNTVAEKSPFTIKGYTITIKKEGEEPIYINILKKDDLEPALTEAISTFVKTENLEAYLHDNQVEIKDTGKTIKNLYFDEKITIKEAYLSVEEPIITNKSDLTKYLLFGTLEPYKDYVVKEGDTLADIAFKNELSNEELLIANPKLSSIDSLISPGQKLNIGLVNPLFTIVEEAEIIADVPISYETITETNSSIFASDSYIKQQGVNGVNRVTQQAIIKNGETTNMAVSGNKEITKAINHIIVKGTKPSNSFSNLPPAASSTDWGWPTISPYVITSKFGYRWGRLHRGIDISGTGRGSPIYSSTEGTVVKVNNNCPNEGYYGSPCGGQFGNYIEVEMANGLVIFYAHMQRTIKVSVGQQVSKGTLIGYMGNSGSSTGPHLHFEIRSDGSAVNPCKVAFVC